MTRESLRNPITKTIPTDNLKPPTQSNPFNDHLTPAIGAFDEIRSHPTTVTKNDKIDLVQIQKTKFSLFCNVVHNICVTRVFSLLESTHGIWEMRVRIVFPTTPSPRHIYLCRQRATIMNIFGLFRFHKSSTPNAKLLRLFRSRIRRQNKDFSNYSTYISFSSTGKTNSKDNTRIIVLFFGEINYLALTTYLLD